MTLAEKINTLDRKIEVKSARYNLYNLSSSGNSDKYEYLTDQYLPSKPGITEQINFTYSPLRKGLKNKQN